MGGRTNTLLLVDALNLIRRVHAAQPGEDGPDRVAGSRASSVQSLRRALRECAPTHAVCVFDGAGRSWRHQLYPGYKAGHPAMPEALGSALGSFREAFHDIGVASLSLPTFEADDVIATAATKATAAGAAATTAIILSTDKSFFQFLTRPGGTIRVRDHFRRADFDADHVDKKFGVRPEQLVDFLALAGDRGNGIPGVPGIGKKTAAKLLGRFETLERILQAAEEPPGDLPEQPPGRLQAKLGDRLREHADTARLCHRLAGLRTDLELGVNLSELRYRVQ